MSNRIKDDDDFQVSKTSSSSPSTSSTIGLENKKVVVAAKKRRKEAYACKRPTNKPKRPACAYNLFFYVERERILRDNDEGWLYTAADAARAAAAMMQDKPRRKHVKTHGKIAFAALSKTIASHWKNLAPNAREVFEYQASLQATDYANKLAEWKQKQNDSSERGSVDGSSSRSIDTSSAQRRSAVDTFATAKDSNHRDILASRQATHLNNDPTFTKQPASVESKHYSGGDVRIHPYAYHYLTEINSRNQQYIDEQFGNKYRTKTIAPHLPYDVHHMDSFHVSSNNSHLASARLRDVPFGESSLPPPLAYHNSWLWPPSSTTTNNSFLFSDYSEQDITNCRFPPMMASSSEKIHFFEDSILFHPLDRMHSFEDNILLNNDSEFSNHMFGKTRLIPLHDAQLDRMVEELFFSGNDLKEEEPYFDVSIGKASSR